MVSNYIDALYGIYTYIAIGTYILLVDISLYDSEVFIEQLYVHEDHY